MTFAKRTLIFENQKLNNVLHLIKKRAMKKILLSTVILSIGVLGFSQKRAIFPKEKLNESKTTVLQKAVTGAEVIQMPVIPAPSVPAASKGELIAGGTVYDVQTNSSLGNRMWLFDDGTAAAVWTMGLGSNPAGPERGTGYNYFDGTSWGDPPAARIEDDRCGWPSYAAWGENGEIVVSHLAGQTVYPDGGLLINKRVEKGTGEWTQIYLPGPADMGGTDITWPRMTTSGADHSIIHIIVPCALDGVYEGQNRPLFYIKSENGGEDWTDWKILDEINSDYYSGFHADDYTWAESRGNTIAFTISSPWHDWIVMKSTDNGETWTKIVIWEHPYPMWDWDNTITTDTIWATDYSADIAIDADGMVHAVCGLTRVAHTETGTSYSYWPITDGIIYWDETMPSFTAENQHRALAYENLVEDKTLIGYVVDQGIPLLDEVLTYPELGLSTMPSITVSSSGNQVYVAWSSLTEGYDNGQFNFRHIWLRRSYDNGNANSWGSFIDIDTDIGHWLDECIYPVFAGDVEYTNMGQKFHLIYNADLSPGLYFLQTPSQNEPTDNTIYHFSDILVGIGKQHLIDTNVSQNYPNPFAASSVVNVTLPGRTNLSLEVVNLMGQVVFTADKGVVDSGMHTFTIDASNLGSGVYFYTVKAGESSVTRKMLVE